MSFGSVGESNGALIRDSATPAGLTLRSVVAGGLAVSGSIVGIHGWGVVTMSLSVERIATILIVAFVSAFLLVAAGSARHRRRLGVARMAMIVGLPLATWSNAGRAYGLVVALAVLVAHAALVDRWPSDRTSGRVTASVVVISLLSVGQFVWASQARLDVAVLSTLAAGAVVIAQRHRPLLFERVGDALAAAAERVGLNRRWRALSRSTRLIWAASLTAFGLRLLVVAINAGVPLTRDLSRDPGNFVDLAHGIVDGHGLFRNGILTTYWPPVYPYFLAVWVKLESVLGFGSLRFWIGAGQALLAGAAVLALGLLVRRRVDPTVAVITSFVLAMWPNQLMNAPVVMTEGVFSPLYCFGVVAVLWRERPAYRDLVAAGVLFGAAVLTRPAGSAALLGAVLIAVWQWRHVMRTAVASALVVSMAFMATVAPWLAYTNSVVGTPVLSSFVGYNLCMGNSDGATGEFEWSRCRPRPGETVLEGERRMRAEALEWALQHPEQEVVLVVRRFVATFIADYYATFDLPGVHYDAPLPELPVVVVSQAWWVVAVVLAIGGFWARRRDGFYRAAAVAWGAVLVGPLITIGDIRFHDPLVPFMAICVATQVVSLRQRRRGLRGQQPRSGPGGTVALFEPEPHGEETVAGA